MSGEIVVFGTGGLGRETHEAALAEGHEVLGFLDGNAERHGQRVHDSPVLGGIEWLRDQAGVGVVVAVGSPAVRARLVAQIEAHGHRLFGRVVHPRAMLGRHVEVGEGSILLQGASLTTDVRLGRHVVVNPNASIAHDDRIGDLVSIAPGANLSGTVDVGEGCDIGTGAMILQGRRIGAWSIVGAGAVVREDVPPNVTVVGVPARTVKTRPNQWQMQM